MGLGLVHWVSPSKDTASLPREAPNLACKGRMHTCDFLPNELLLVGNLSYAGFTFFLSIANVRATITYDDVVPPLFFRAPVDVIVRKAHAYSLRDDSPGALVLRG